MNRVKKLLERNIIFYCILLMFSTIVAWFCIRWNTTSDELTVSYSYVRVELLEEFMQIIRNNEIPQFLSAYEHSYGYAFYLPYIGVLFGIQEGWQLLLWVQLGAMVVLMVIFPVLIYKVFENKIVAFIAPILVHLFCGNILYGFKTDSFWGMSWTIMLAFPMIYLLSRPGWCYKKTALVVIIGVVCSVGNVMRNHNGFVPMILVFVILLHKFIRKEIKLLNFLLLCVFFYFCYESISTFIPLFVGGCLKLPTLNNGAFVWHAILCGLGHYPNEYGLICNDEIISKVVQQYYPYQVYATNEYANSCRKLVFEILFTNPIFVISVYFSKFIELMKLIIKYVFQASGADYFYFNTGMHTVRNIFGPSVVAVVVGAYNLIQVKGREVFRTYGVIIVFCIVGVVLGSVEALMMIPDLKYGLASVVCISMIPLYVSLIAIHIFAEKTEHR